MKLLIVGAGGHGKVAAETAAATNLYDEIFFVDDSYPKLTRILEYSIVGNTSNLLQLFNKNTHAFIAIGNNQIRQKMFASLIEIGYTITNLLHPLSCISKSAQLDQGILVMPHAVINAAAIVNTGTIINTAAVIEHDCKLGKFVHICPKVALAGGVVIGDRSWIGIGSNVIEKIKIGADVMVGAGSVVIKDVDDYQKIVGVPAKVMQTGEKYE